MAFIGIRSLDVSLSRWTQNQNAIFKDLFSEPIPISIS
jgi:hypothetical protein